MKLTYRDSNNFFRFPFDQVYPALLAAELRAVTFNDSHFVLLYEDGLWVGPVSPPHHGGDKVGVGVVHAELAGEWGWFRENTHLNCVISQQQAAEHLIKQIGEKPCSKKYRSK